MDISPIFNFFGLYEYHESNDEVFVSDNYPKKQIEEVKQILDQKVGKSTRGKDYYVLGLTLDRNNNYIKI